MSEGARGVSRRRLFELIGASVGGAAAYQAMTRLGHAEESPYRGPIKLEGDPKGASVVILGAGLAGMTAAIELERAGYRVSVLEYNARPGGRNWTIRGGDIYTELGGATQKCEFDTGLYLNPGPWRIPYHHYAILDYCRRFGVALEPFIQLNHNAYLHSPTVFDGKPQRIRDVKADYEGGVAELLAKATKKGALDDAVSTEDREILLEALRSLGALDKDFRYRTGEDSAAHRGYAKHSGGGLGAEPVAGEPIGLHDILTSRLWRGLQNFLLYDFQTTMFQPVGGMGRIGEAFARQIPDRIRYGAKVVDIRQSDSGVAVAFEDLTAGGIAREVSADWCVCTIPLSILSQIPINVSAPMKAAIDAVPYASGGEVRAAVLAPILGGGRAYFWRDQLHQPADPADLVPQHEFQRRWERRAPRRICIRWTECLRVHSHVSGRKGAARGRVRRSDPFAIFDRVRERRFGRLEPGPVHAWLRGQLVR